MVVSFGANAPRPVLHQVSAAQGDLTRTPAFPNRKAAAKRALGASELLDLAPRLGQNIPAHGVITWPLPSTPLPRKQGPSAAEKATAVDQRPDTAWRRVPRAAQWATLVIAGVVGAACLGGAFVVYNQRAIVATERAAAEKAAAEKAAAEKAAAEKAAAEKAAAEKAAAKDEREFSDCERCPKMVVVQAGEFEMGSGEKYAKPKHLVVIANSFVIGPRKVTFEEFCFAYADADRCKRQPKDDGQGRGSRPVIGVTWDEAKTFVKGLSRKPENPIGCPARPSGNMRIA
jgi:hypothetical protein